MADLEGAEKVLVEGGKKLNSSQTWYKSPKLFAFAVCLCHLLGDQRQLPQSFC